MNLINVTDFVVVPRGVFVDGNPGEVYKAVQLTVDGRDRFLWFGEMSQSHGDIVRRFLDTNNLTYKMMTAPDRSRIPARNGDRYSLDGAGAALVRASGDKMIRFTKTISGGYGVGIDTTHLEAVSAGLEKEGWIVSRS